VLPPEYAWALLFWGALTAVCLVEATWPGLRGDADRRRRWPVNFGLGILNGYIASLVPTLTVFSAIWAAIHGVGLLNMFASPLWLGIVLAVAVKALSQYAFHRCMHALPILWRVHRVHHSDDHLDASSALRFHPLELIASILFVLPWVVLFGLPPAILAAYEAAQILMGLFTHANISIPERFERGARLLLVTPAMHRFHHSTIEAQANSNYSDVFSILDRMFGTFHDIPRGEMGPARFGLTDIEPQRARDFLAQLQLPLK
jgi:sterol desaturase/sphingolipid hydroxylase (fatty acid hydroxylase superfamily)